MTEFRESCKLPAPADVHDAVPHWSIDMTVGNAAIDADHRAFFDIVRLLQSALADPGAEQSVIPTALALLQEYVLGHFIREEKAMRDACYPKLTEHIAIHRGFRAKIEKIADLCDHGDWTAAKNLPEIVGKWLQHHIAIEDHDYALWIKKIEVDARPLGIIAIESDDIH